MCHLCSSLFLWLANCVPNFYALRFLKAILLRIAGVKLNVFAFYFMSSFHIDRPFQVSIGKGVFVNRNCIIEGLGWVSIGNNVQVGPNVVFATTNHKLGKMEEVSGDIRILENVWVGANVVIVQGVTLGPNVIVAAGAVVTKNFADCMVAGVPATAVKSITNAAGKTFSLLCN